jgi:hypothetical protein
LLSVALSARPYMKAISFRPNDAARSRLGVREKPSSTLFQIDLEPAMILHRWAGLNPVPLLENRVSRLIEKCNPPDRFSRKCALVSTGSVQQDRSLPPQHLWLSLLAVAQRGRDGEPVGPSLRRGCLGRDRHSAEQARCVRTPGGFGSRRLFFSNRGRPSEVVAERSQWLLDDHPPAGGCRAQNRLRSLRRSSPSPPHVSSRLCPSST